MNLSGKEWCALAVTHFIYHVFARTQKACRKANAISLPPGIRSSSDLKWWYENNRYYPCRICDVMEGTYINLDPLWDTTELALIQVLEYPPTKPFRGRDRILANRDDLQDYGKGDAWDACIWKKYTRQRANDFKSESQKLLSESDVRAGYLYLNRILKAAKERDFIPEQEITIDEAENDDNSDFETPYEVNLDLPSNNSTCPSGISKRYFDDKIREPLRPGDVIQYTSPIFCAGDPRGLSIATILSTNPDTSGYMIRLDNMELLPNEHMIKRIKAMEQGKQYAHNGFYRSINRFAMKKRSLDVDTRQLFLRTTESIGAIVDKGISKFRKSMRSKGLPEDLVPDFISRRKLKADHRLEQSESAPEKTYKGINDAKASRSVLPLDSKIFSVKTRSILSNSCIHNSDTSDSDDSLEVVPYLKAVVPASAKKASSYSSPLDLFGTPSLRIATASKTSNASTCFHSQASDPHKQSSFVAAILNEGSPPLNRKRHPVSHDESDSESSIENHGLNTAAREKTEKVDRFAELKTSIEKEFPLGTPSRGKGGPNQDPNYNDKKAGCMRSSKRQYPYHRIEGVSFALSKVNSNAERPSTKGLHIAYTSSDQTNSCLSSIVCRGQGRKDNSQLVAISTRVKEERNKLNKEFCLQHIHPRNCKGGYSVEEDDAIEDCDMDMKVSAHSPRSSKGRDCKPILQLSSRTASNNNGFDE